MNALLRSLARLRLPVALLVALAGSRSAQQVLVVDRNLGPGTDFQFINPAVMAAQEGDLLLVREGTYDGVVTIDGKGLSLVAELGDDVAVRALTVRNLSASQSVTVRGIGFYESFQRPQLELLDNAGPVWVEDCEASAFFHDFSGSAVLVERCAAAVLRGLVADQGSYIGSTFGYRGPCLEIRESTAALYRCDVTGTRIMAAGSPAIGGTGVVVFDAMVTLYGSTIRGGQGDMYETMSGTGGTALEVTGVLGTSVVDRVETSLIGGVGEPGVLTPGPSGAPLSITGAGGVVNSLGGIAHAFAAPSPLRSGASITLQLTGDASDRAFVLFASEPGALLQIASAIGPLVLPPSAEILPLGVLPATPAHPTVDLPFVVPAVPSGFESFHIQPLFLGSATNPHVALGTPTHVHVLDASF